MKIELAKVTFALGRDGCVSWRPVRQLAMTLLVALIYGCSGGGDSQSVGTVVDTPPQNPPAAEAPAVHAIQPDEVDDYIRNFEAQQAELLLTIEGTDYHIEFLDIIEDLGVLVSFDLGIMLIGYSDGMPNGDIEVRLGDIANPESVLSDPDAILISAQTSASPAGDSVLVEGSLVDQESGDTVLIRLVVNDAIIEGGNSKVSVEGEAAVVTGTLGAQFYVQVRDLTDTGSGVTTIRLQQVDGSINDEINVHTGRLIRSRGLRTLIPMDGIVQSGGVDIFAAGEQRNVEIGGRAGVHSWCCDSEGRPADALDRDDPAHGVQLTYFREMLGAELGEEFYFFTINAAAFDDMYFMNDDELQKFLLTP